MFLFVGVAKQGPVVCQNPEQNYLHRIIISQLLKTRGSQSLEAKDTKPDVQEWVCEVNGFLPESFHYETYL